VRQLDNENPDNDVADGDDKAKEDIKLKRQLSRSRRNQGNWMRKSRGSYTKLALHYRVAHLVDTLSILTCQLLLFSSVKLRNLQLYLCVSSKVKGRRGRLIRRGEFCIGVYSIVEISACHFLV